MLLMSTNPWQKLRLISTCILYLYRNVIEGCKKMDVVKKLVKDQLIK